MAPFSPGRALSAVVFALIAVFVVSPHALRAGTTGGLNGTVVDAKGAPAADARITVTSPSQVAAATTDAHGNFTFVSLAPDTYTISVEKQGFEAIATSGISVFADARQTLNFTLKPELKTIGRVVATTRGGGLVKPGTTADVYSVDAAQQDRLSALGGGGNLNSAYSAIASVPGAYVPANQEGYNQTVHIRGGDSDQVGYEFDGIPVNRAFDNYPSGSTSSLGQLELQVYTGASPANSEAQGLAGFVNQVIKSGTFPGFADFDAALGGPAFYHQFNFEAGGANPQRTFSYYVALGGFDQDHRYVDQYNGASISNEFGSVLSTCPLPGSGPLPPSCLTNGKPNVSGPSFSSYPQPGYLLGPLTYGGLEVPSVETRTSIVNLHFGIPHKNDGLKDDIQILYDNDEIFTPIFSSALDEGLQNVIASGLSTNGRIPYSDAWQYTGQMGTFLPANYQSLVVPYYFPSSPQNRPFDGDIPINQRDVGFNQQGIVKIQYQRNFNAASFLRLYGYTYYSDYINTGPNSSTQPITGYYSGDYELSAHTRGVSATYENQIDSHNLLELQGSYTTSRALRMYNEQMFDPADAFAVLVDKNAPLSGICYNYSGSGNTAAPTTCSDNAYYNGSAGAATFASLAGIGCTTHPTFNNCSSGALPPNVNGVSCGGGPCAFYVAENGAYGEYNQVKPVFTGYSLTDEFKPTSKLSFNLGVRLDHYLFQGADTNGPARQFWFNAFNQDTCFDPASGALADKVADLGIAVTAPCSSAVGGVWKATNLQNVSGQQFSYDVLQPRFGVTFTVSPDTVLRASYGKFNEQPSSAYQQYSALQQNLPDLLGPEFYSYGFTTPGHPVRPSISYNSDFSLEQQIPKTSLSFKLTPFYRHTADQVQSFYLNVKASLVSGLNVGSQTSQGFEFELNDGDFGRNGFATQLSFAYTNSYVTYQALPNGSTVVSPINADIQTYNAYTSFCYTHPKDSRCGAPPAGEVAAPCYSPTSSTPVPVYTCGPGDIANPYWNAPVQSLLDPGARYLPYTIFPASIGTGDNAFNYPYVTTLIFNFKHNRFAITPSLQFTAGNRYGAPETMPGINPATCTGALATGVSGDPRYPYGAPGGAGYDASTCGTLNAIPDSFTGKFDALGAFRQPAQLLANMRMSYDVSKRVQIVATFANLIDRCFGGQQTAFTYYTSAQVCSYGSLAAGASPVGNVYNPGDNVQTFLRYPYEPSFGTYNDNGDSTVHPFSAYLSLRVKL
jgi:hypothetical protein